MSTLLIQTVVVLHGSRFGETLHAYLIVHRIRLYLKDIEAIDVPTNSPDPVATHEHNHNILLYRFFSFAQRLLQAKDLLGKGRLSASRQENNCQLRQPGL